MVVVIELVWMTTLGVCMLCIGEKDPMIEEGGMRFCDGCSCGCRSSAKSFDREVPFMHPFCIMYSDESCLGHLLVQCYSSPQKTTLKAFCFYVP